MAGNGERVAVEVIGTVFSQAEDEALREATRKMIAPLVKLADVSPELRAAALAVPPLGVDIATLPYTATDIAAHLACFVEDGKLRINERGAYEAVNVSDPGVSEARRFTQEILAGWPDDAAEKIVSVFDEKEEG